MKTIDKYSNLDETLPELPKVLKDALQTDFLEVKSVEKTCEKYQTECAAIPMLNKASYVIYSPYIKKADHEHEIFIFVDELGKILCHVGGVEMELYGLIKPCNKLHLSEEYKNAIIHKD